MSYKYKKGDLVRVYSLQSFYHGGFLNGDFAIISQDQCGASVLVTVCRNISGEYNLDFSYELYEKQLESIISFDKIKERDRIKLNKMLLEKSHYNEICNLDNKDFQSRYKKLMLSLSKKYS
ncbi:MAG: hypothetical protein WA061_02520 [Microgenomates group bacterium]